MSVDDQNGCRGILLRRPQVDKRAIAGVVLAGGRSSRMGQDKALLDYHGRPLLDHMIGLLEQAGLSDVYVSGDLEGYRCIPDRAPYEGPARAIANVLATLGDYEGVLFVPVDMPFLTPEALGRLLAQRQGAHYTSYPLPFYITRHWEGVDGVPKGGSVKALLLALGGSSLDLPKELEGYMTNANTPEEWQEVLRA